MRRQARQAKGIVGHWHVRTCGRLLRAGPWMDGRKEIVSIGRAACSPAKNALACALDVEGIVAKRADRPYDDHPTGRSWVTIKNSSYSQKEGRGDLFKRAG